MPSLGRLLSTVEMDYCVKEKPVPPNVPDTVAPAIQHPPNIEVEIYGDPLKVTCPYCSEHVESKVHYKIGSAGVAMMCFTMPFLLCWVPLIVKRFKDAKHYCPACQRQLGYFGRF